MFYISEGGTHLLKEPRRGQMFIENWKLKTT